MTSRNFESLEKVGPRRIWGPARPVDVAAAVAATAADDAGAAEAKWLEDRLAAARNVAHRVAVSAGAAWPATVQKRRSGYMVGEWFPQTIIFSMSLTDLPVRLASCDTARLWSRRSIAVKFFAGRLEADFMAM